MPMSTLYHQVLPGLAICKAVCVAVETSTRVLWSGAAATDPISPRPWDYLPDYTSSLDYFTTLGDLELMAVTHQYRITWEVGAMA